MLTVTFSLVFGFKKFDQISNSPSLFSSFFNCVFSDDHTISVLFLCLNVLTFQSGVNTLNERLFPCVVTHCLLFLSDD